VERGNNGTPAGAGAPAEGKAKDAVIDSGQQAPNPKQQISNKLQIPMSRIGSWILKIICYLDLVIWNFNSEDLR
jgi:hypothetical protein